MKYLVFFLLFTSSVSFAEDLKMHPGLWKVEMSFKDASGKEINPAKAIDEALKKMPAEKRKEAEAMMNKMNPGALDNQGMKVCYSEKMIKNPESLANQEKGKCDSKVLSKTPTEIKTSFKCKDGNKGEATWTVVDKDTYHGTVTIDSPNRGKSTVKYQGKFVSKDCGDVKPIDA